MNGFVHTYVLIPKEEENANEPGAERENGGSEENIETAGWKLHVLACLPWERRRRPKLPGNRGQNPGWRSSPPPYHTHKPHKKIVSLPSYLCILATLLFMPSPRLIRFLPAVTVFCPLLSGALEGSCSLQQRPEAVAWAVWTLSEPTVTFTRFIGSLNSVPTPLPWQMSELMALIFSPLLSSLGSFPLCIPQPFCLRISCGRFALS